MRHLDGCYPKETKILFADVFIQPTADRLSGNILAFGRNLPEKPGKSARKKLSYLDQEAASLTWLLMRNKQTEKARRKYTPILSKEI